MNENVDIFICTHKDFEKVVSNDVYKILDSRDIRKEYKILGVLDDYVMSEWLHLFYLAEKCKLKEYVGICHYRRYYDFLDNVPNIEKIFNDYDLITRQPIKVPLTIKTQYGYCHNIEDLNMLGCILKEKFSEYYDVYNSFLELKLFIPCNMFIMKKEDFLNFMKIVKEIVKEFFWRVGIDFEKKIKENETKY